MFEQVQFHHLLVVLDELCVVEQTKRRGDGTESPLLAVLG
jgi:hypothetical protein